MNQIVRVLTWPRKKYREIQGSVLNLTPRKKWELVVKTCDFLLCLIGIRLVNDCERNWRTPLTLLCATEWTTLSIYTAWYYWDENKVSSIQPLTMAALVIPGLLLYIRAVGPTRYRYRRLLTFSGRNIYSNRKPCTDYEREVDHHAGNLITHSLITTIVVLLSYAQIIVGPIYAFVVYGEYATPTEVVLPFTDPSSYRAYAANMFVQMITAVVGLIGMISIEGGSCVINNTFTLMADLACFNMRKFSDGLCQRTFSYQDKLELRNIFVQLQDLEAFLSHTNKLYYWKFFLQPLLTTGCVALGIIAQFTNGFTSGYGTALCLYFQLFIMCYMGNGVKNVCEQIQRELYGIKWYMMPPKYQKQVAAALHRWQKGCAITIGPFEELNYVTATQLTKKIYTILMVFMTYV